MPTESAVPRLSPSGPSLAVNSATTMDLTQPGSEFGSVSISGVGISGLVAGSVQIPANGFSSHAFRWTPGDGFQDMGTLGGPGNISFGLGINVRGEVVGQSQTAAGRNGPLHAFRASRPRNYSCPVGSCGFVDLGAGSPHLLSAAYAINKNGFVAGEIGNQAVRWGPDNSVTYLGNFGTTSTGVAINSYGTVAGYSRFENGDVHAFRMFEGKMLDLGTLGGTRSYATGINDHGYVVGYSDNALGQTRAFLWTPKDGMRDLGILGSGFGNTSTASGINNFNQIIGHSHRADRSHGAFLWTEQEGMMDITDIAGNFPFASGFSDNLRFANGSLLTTLQYSRP